jgi:thioredoxin family protein
VVSRILIAVALVAVVLVVAARMRRRRPAPPPRDAYPVPRQLDRSDFPRPEAPWLVAYFSSTVCDSCRGLGPKVAVLESDGVSVCEADAAVRRDLHDRYDISAIPMILVADTEGVVRRAFVGATTATDLWAAVAELRAPGTTPEPDLGGM